jgi:hypothetical protein
VTTKGGGVLLVSSAWLGKHESLLTNSLIGIVPGHEDLSYQPSIVAVSKQYWPTVSFMASFVCEKRLAVFENLKDVK